MHLFEFNQMEWFLAGITLILFFILLYYCFFFYNNPFKKSEPEEFVKRKDDKQPPVSIILYAQDNVQRVECHLPVFMNQNYPDYEVIVVADEVGDECVNALSMIKGEYENLYISYVPSKARFISRKKLALTLGVKAAHHEIMFFSDMGVEPVGPDWLNGMVRCYQENTKMVIGASFYPYTHGWKNKFIGLDNLRYTLQYLSAALHGHPFDGTGKNLSYTKDLFFQYKGFYNHLHLKVGEASLFIDEAATSDNAVVCYDVKTLMKREEVSSLKEWVHEKSVAVTISKLFKNKYYRLFNLEIWLYLLFIMVDILLIKIGLAGNYLLALFASILLILYYGIKTLFFIRLSRLFSQQIKWYNFAVLDLVNNLYIACLNLTGWFVRKKDYVFVVEK